MTRQLRIEYPGACYHVTARGNQKLAIFLDDDDRHYFLKCLGDAHLRFDIIIHVYCLMENHYHLLVETPKGNLSRALHLINTAHSIYFNKKHGRCGHPFQGRFKAILVQVEAYARELAPYIHLNPVRCGLVNMPEKYPWSNYSEYLGRKSHYGWTSTSRILSLFGSNPVEAKKAYADYVTWRMGQRLPNPLDGAIKTGVLGTVEFIDQIKKRLQKVEHRHHDRELPHLRRLQSTPTLEAIFALAQEIFGSDNKLARRAAIYVTHHNTAYPLREIAAFHHLSISRISEICRKISIDIPSNSTLARAVDQLEGEFFR